MAKNDWLRMKEYYEMPLTEYLNAVSLYLHLKRKRNKVLNDATSGAKSSEPAKMAILGQIFDNL